VELVRHRQTKETEQIGFTYGTPRQSSTLHILIFVGLTSHGQCESAVLLADARWILGLAREPAAEAVVERKKGSRPLFSSLFARICF